MGGLGEAWKTWGGLGPPGEEAWEGLGKLGEAWGGWRWPEEAWGRLGKAWQEAWAKKVEGRGG